MTTGESEIGLDESALSKRIKSRKTGVSAYAKNPFWKPYEIDVGAKKITISGGTLVDTGSGEAMNYAGIHKVEYVDEDRFIKLFTQNLRVFFDLSPASQKVLQCVLSTLQESPNSEGIFLPWFTVEDYSKAHNLSVSRATFHRALKEMLSKGFLAESENQNYYWINPHLFFNGNRMMFVNEYRKIEKGAHKENGKKSKDGK
jgi:predicted transcriptional regulator